MKFLSCLWFIHVAAKTMYKCSKKNKSLTYYSHTKDTHPMKYSFTPISPSSQGCPAHRLPPRKPFFPAAGAATTRCPFPRSGSPAGPGQRSTERHSPAQRRSTLPKNWRRPPRLPHSMAQTPATPHQPPRLQITALPHLRPARRPVHHLTRGGWCAPAAASPLRCRHWTRGVWRCPLLRRPEGNCRQCPRAGHPVNAEEDRKELILVAE